MGGPGFGGLLPEGMGPGLGRGMPGQVSGLQLLLWSCSWRNSRAAWSCCSSLLLLVAIHPVPPPPRVAVTS